MVLTMGCVLAAGAQAAQPSAGCGQGAPAPTQLQLEVAGRNRQAIVVPPPAYQPRHPYPLVLAFHGRTNGNVQVRDYFGLEVPGFPAILVYPAGLQDARGRYSWSDPGDSPESLRDFALFDALLDRLEAGYCVDRDAVFVVGHSLGASFANSLACHRADRIRGLGSVAGGIVGRRCGRAPASLLLHNPRDAAVPVAEGLTARATLLGRAPASASPLVLEGDYACVEDRGGADPVLWCPYHENLNRRGRFYPHQWPRMAGATIMNFFAGLTLPGR